MPERIGRRPVMSAARLRANQRGSLGLASTALPTATSSGTPAQAETPGQVAQDLAPIWSLCIWVIADSENNVSPDLRRHIIQQYLIFVLALGGAPSEIYVGSVGSDVEGLDVWRDLFSSELRDRFTLSRDLLLGCVERCDGVFGPR